MTRCLATVLSLLLLSSTGPDIARAEHRGVVFDDANANGVRDAGEAARAGVAVTNGRDVVVTGPDGRYELSEHAAGFVHVSCPADADCPVWYLRGSGGGDGDFALVPSAPVSDFFFVHMSDVHAYSKVEDMAGLLPAGGLPWWLPRNLVGWFLLRTLASWYPDTSREEIVAQLRGIVAEHRDVEGAWDSTLMMDYFDLALDPATKLVQPEILIPQALAEVNALAPRFVINTGDLVLEGNSGDADPVERWYDYYTRVADESGLAIYETIGNNELGGTDNDAFTPDDPRYGKALFRQHFGPTHYSFEQGPFHFAAVDTHRREFEPGEDEEWSFNDMEPSVRDWLDADLAAAKGRVLVVLNHEPFHDDPVWGFDDFEMAQDEGLFSKHGVAYALAGHIHRNGFQDAPPSGGVTHITTGALSGFRWSLPTPFDAHGYRLVYAHEGRLYSAWKDVGRPLLGFVDPKGDAAIHPASTHATTASEASGDLEVTAVAADVDGPFASVALSLNGEPVAASRWGDYFVHAHVAADRIPAGGGTFVLTAKSRDGRDHEVRLDVSSAAR
jgi:3',5'-cyclic AMP phosphodiesterase CpdA